MHRSRAALIGLLVCLIPLTAKAGTQDLFGFGARGPSLSGSFVAMARGFESVYYNPAGLSYGKGTSFSFAYQAGIFDLDLRTPRSEVASRWKSPDLTSGVSFGFDVKLPLLGALKDRLALGVGLYVPTQELFSAKLPSPYTPQLWIGGSNARSVAIQAALAVKATNWLRIGVGIRALASLHGSIAVAPNQTGNLGSSVEDELVVVYSACAGLVIQPHGDWFIGVAWRDKLVAPFDVPITVDLGDALPLRVPQISIAGNANYDPMQLAIGLGWKPMAGLSIEAGMLWKHWSPFGLPIKNATANIPPQSPMSFTDTVVTRLGIQGRFEVTELTYLSVRAGYAYEPTPVPHQSGEHNFLDPDRHIISSGIGFSMEFKATKITADLYGQLHMLAPRVHTKSFGPDNSLWATQNQGFPWVGLEGQLYSVGATVGLQF